MSTDERMLKMEITCPSCGQVCEVDEEPMVGQHLQCPFCEVKFSYTSQELSASNAANRTVLKKTSCPYCGTNYEVNANYVGAVVSCGTCNKQFVVQVEKKVPKPRQVPVKRIFKKDNVDRERTLLQTSPDIRRAYPFLAMMAIIAMGSFFIGDGTFIAIVVGGCVLFSVMVILAFKSMKYEITNKRVIAKELSSETGQRRTSEIWIRDIRYVDIEEPFLINILGLANVRIATSGTGGVEIVLRGIKEFNEVKEILNTYRQAN